MGSTTKKKLEYWSCIIGPVVRDDLPESADFPLRNSVKNAYHDVTGTVDEVCSSGWGVTEELKDMISILLVLGPGDERYSKIKKILFKK